MKINTVACAGDDSAYRLLFSSYHAGSPILDKDRTKVFQMSAFKDDQSSEAQKQMIGEIRKAIECGDTCFLMYTEAIHGSLYDLFNQFFTVQRDKDQNAKLYVQIGIGSYSKVRRHTACMSSHEEHQKAVPGVHVIKCHIVHQQIMQLLQESPAAICGIT